MEVQVLSSAWNARKGVSRFLTSSAGAATVIEHMFAEGDQVLTERQRQILDFLTKYADAHGYPPTVREIGEAVGLVSPSSVAYQLKELEKKGFLRRDPNRPRAVDVRTPSELTPDEDEALHAAQRFNIEAVKRVNSGTPRPVIEDEADQFFIDLLGHERTPEWCTREAGEQIARIRQQWV